MSNKIPLTVFEAYGLSPADFTVDRIGSGHIHFTYKITSHNVSYILQRVNKNVFRKPEIIASNLRVASTFLGTRFPQFVFLTPIATKAKDEMVYDEEGYPWRLFPYFPNTFTIDKVATAKQAFDAAAEFGRLAKNLDAIDVNLFWPTIDRFHDLQWRWEQFQESLGNATPERLNEAQTVISAAEEFQFLVSEYNRLIESHDLRLRITHNDTKINNVLFDSQHGTTLCAIDLDTLMPGYYIYDLGDMIRTFVSPVDEEEKDLDKISVRSEIYNAVIEGYLSEMNETLSVAEKSAIPFSGLMMTYIMALRMLTDFLNGDVYYQVKYSDHNLVRARNQFRLLELLNRQQVGT